MVAAHAWYIEIFGQSAGRLVADGDRFVFHAAVQTLLELDRCSFSRDSLKPSRRFIRCGYGACTGVRPTFVPRVRRREKKLRASSVTSRFSEF